MECFKQVASNVGELIEIDVATSEWERLDYARLKVNAPVPDKAEVSKRIKINYKVYWVTLEEEIFDFDRAQCRGWSSGITVSDSNSFSVFMVDETEHLYEDLDEGASE